MAPQVVVGRTPVSLTISRLSQARVSVYLVKQPASNTSSNIINSFRDSTVIPLQGIRYFHVIDCFDFVFPLIDAAFTCNYVFPFSLFHLPLSSLAQSVAHVQLSRRSLGC